jgi:gluconate kinase
VNQIILISGPPGAGKTAVAGALCERFDRMLLIEVDDLRHLVRAGFRHADAGDHQAREQLELGARNAAAIARQSAAVRYSSVIADIVTAEAVDWYRDAFEGTPTQVDLVTLFPDLDTTEARDISRDAAMGERVRVLHDQLASEIEADAIPGSVLDSSTHANARETADVVQDAISRGHALFIAPTEA